MRRLRTRRRVVRDQPENSHALGKYLLSLFTENSWALRRVERIKQIDLSRFEVRTSVDLDLRKIRQQADLAGIASEDGLIVPLALFEKALHLDFDVRIADGEQLQLLTSEENSVYSREMLLALLRNEGCSERFAQSVAEAILQVTQPQDSLTSQLRVDTVDANELLMRFVNPADRLKLAKVRDFFPLLERLRTHYLALVRITDTDDAVTTVKYRFIEDGGEWKPTFLERIGLNYPTLEYSGQIGLSKSEHKLFEMPAGLILDAALPVIQLEEVEGYLRLEDVPAIRSRERSAPKLYALHAKSEKRANFRQVIRMSPGLGEFHLPAVANVGLTLSMLLICLWFEAFGPSFSSLNETSSLVAILALVPAILNGFLTLPGEHPVVARLFSTLRGMVFVVSGLTVVSGLLIALHAASFWILTSLIVSASWGGMVISLLLTSIVHTSRRQVQHSA